MDKICYISRRRTPGFQDAAFTTTKAGTKAYEDQVNKAPCIRPHSNLVQSRSLFIYNWVLLNALIIMQSRNECATRVGQPMPYLPQSPFFSSARQPSHDFDHFPSHEEFETTCTIQCESVDHRCTKTWHARHQDYPGPLQITYRFQKAAAIQQSLPLLCLNYKF